MDTLASFFFTVNTITVFSVEIQFHKLLSEEVIMIKCLRLC